jgi:hypothetical protein
MDAMQQWWAFMVLVDLENTVSDNGLSSHDYAVNLL